MVTAINIPTDVWNTILDWLVARQWKIVYRYDNFDMGIDFDLVILQKDKEEIRLGWDNWFEGELQCTEPALEKIASHIGYTFTLGEPDNLKAEVVQLYWPRR